MTAASRKVSTEKSLEPDSLFRENGFSGLASLLETWTIKRAGSQRKEEVMQDIPDLLEGLRRSPAILSELVKAIPESKMNQRRGEGFWTISEHVNHLARVQPMLLGRLQRFMTEDHPEFIPFIPGNEDDQAKPMQVGVADALGQFEKYRDRQIALLDGADGSTWQKQGTHPEYETYSLYILGRHILMHDFWHMYRIEELWLTRDAYLTRLG